MSKYQLALRAGKLLNRRTLRFFAILGTVMAVCTAILSALGAVLVVRQLRLVSLQRKTLPVLRDAAQLYLEKNGGVKSAAGRKKRLFFSRAKKEPEPVESQKEAEGS